MNDRTTKTSTAGSLLLAVLLTLLVGACQGGSGPQGSGESHFGKNRAFLRVCEDGRCETGDACACAVCTVACTTDVDCGYRVFGADDDLSDLPANVQCRPPVCGEGDLEEANGNGVCEVTCTDDADCLFLDETHEGQSHVCRGQFCRTVEQPTEPETLPLPMAPCPDGRALIPGAVAPDGVGLCLDVTEVTVEAFESCVTAGDCEAPDSGNYLTAGRQQHPIHFVDLVEAQNYCAFAGGRLPRSDEWQPAAIGGTTEDSYPWGDPAPDAGDLPQRVCALGATETCPVDAFAAGIGPYGHVDLSGNVAELVLDGAAACAAGGDFESDAAELTADSCTAFDTPAATVGFRCLSDL